MSLNNSSCHRAFRSQVAQLNHKVLDLLGSKTAPVTLFFYIMLNALENIANKITLVHAKKVCKLRGLSPAGLE